MKLVNDFAHFLNSKKFLILLLLVLNCFVITNQKIAVSRIMMKRAIRAEYKRMEVLRIAAFGNRTYKYKMTNQARITFGEKLKFFLLGFLIPILSNLLEEFVEGDAVKNFIVPIIEECFEETYSHYDKLVENIKKKTECDPKIPFKVLHDEWKVEIQGVCSKKQAIDILDAQEYSSFNVVKGLLKNIFSDNSEYMKGYFQFKSDYNELIIKVGRMNDFYIKKFELEMKKYDKNRKEYKYFVWALEGLKAWIIKKKNICDIMEYCQSISLLDRIKIFGNSAVFFLNCVPGAIKKNAFFKSVYDKLNNKLKEFGLSALISALVGSVIPTKLIGMVITLLWRGWNILSKVISLSWSYQPGNAEYDDEEKELYMQIGGLLGDLFSQLIGISSLKNIVSKAMEKVSHGVTSLFKHRKFRILKK